VINEKQFCDCNITTKLNMTNSQSEEKWKTQFEVSAVTLTYLYVHQPANKQVHYTE